MSQFQGVVPAIITPVDANGDLHVESFEQLLARLYDRGAHGMYVCGQTGEGLQLPLSVREKAAEVAVANTPAGRQVIVHVGASSTADALHLARHAAAIGAHGVSSLPPGSAYSFREVKSYYEALAAASSVPVLVYYFPDFSAAIRSVEEVYALCEIPNVVGLKFTDFDLYRLSLIRHAGYTIFNGRDEVFAAGLLMGANGGIGSFYNLVPELFVSVYNDASRGDWTAARATQDRINNLIRAVLKFPLLAAIKQLLTWSGIDSGQPIQPRRPLDAGEEALLRNAVAEAGFSPDGFLR